MDRKTSYKSVSQNSESSIRAGFKDIFTIHLPAAKLQVERLEQIFELLNETPKVKKSDVVAALLDETTMMMQLTGKRSSVKDTGLMFTVLKIKHYEIATYTALLQLAKTMGNEDIIPLLEQTLTEKKDADDLLKAISDGYSRTPDNESRMEEQYRDDDKEGTVYKSINLTGKH